MPYATFQGLAARDYVMLAAQHLRES